MKPAHRGIGWGLGAVVTWSAILLLPLAPVAADETHWIWSPEQRTGSVPEGVCYFRKSFTLDQPAAAELRIAADDEYEAYLNGRRIGTGESTQQLDQYDVSSFVRSGPNLLAVRVANKKGLTAALGARLMVNERARGVVKISSDASWLTNVWPLPLWNTPLYNDSRWARANARAGRKDRALGRRSRRAADRWQADAVRPAGADAHRPTSGGVGEKPILLIEKEQPSGLGRERAAGVDCRCGPGPDSGPARLANPPLTVERPAAKTASGGGGQFVVEQLLDNKTTGSLLAATFNEFGHLLAAREQGGCC